MRSSAAPPLQSLLHAIVRLDGDALVMHVGEHPYVITTAGHVEVGSRGLPYDVIAELLWELAPKEAPAALLASGAVQYACPSLPDLPAEHFTVVATSASDDLCVVIRRHRTAAGQHRRPVTPHGRPPAPSTLRPHDVQDDATLPSRRMRAGGSRTPEPGALLAPIHEGVRVAPRFPPLVLYIEDSLDQLDLYEIGLSGRYEFLGASDGRAGIALAATRQPDVILTDLNMPGMNGWEVCRLLKSNPQTATIPIMVLTAHERVDIEQEAMRVGIADVLHKPCFVDALRDRIDRVIGHQVS